MVSERLASEIGAEAYLAGYLKENSPLPDYSLETVLKAAGTVEEMVTGRFRPENKPKNQK